jgi:hypothetical protein
LEDRDNETRLAGMAKHTSTVTKIRLSISLNIIDLDISKPPNAQVHQGSAAALINDEPSAALAPV